MRFAISNPQFKPKARMRRGFSFTEVMFAVVILGIGFIMIAAVFPVAIQETKTNSEETTAAAVVRGAYGIVKNLGTVSGNFPANGGVTEFPAATLNTIRGSLVSDSDPRFAWVGLYNRTGATSTIMQVYFVVLQSRNQDTYKKAPTIPTGNSATFSLDPDSGETLITINGANPEVAAEGAYVVLAGNGRIYRIGSQVNGNTWKIQPGSDSSTGGGLCYVLGRGLRDPSLPWNATTNPYEGFSQDVTLYTTYVPVTP